MWIDRDLLKERLQRMARQYEALARMNTVASLLEKSYFDDIEGTDEGVPAEKKGGPGEGQELCAILTAQLYAVWANEATIIDTMTQLGCDIPDKP